MQGKPQPVILCIMAVCGFYLNKIEMSRRSDRGQEEIEDSPDCLLRAGMVYYR